ncbi:nose resistant to fluoxetine protein 6-like [Haliotis rubra]|uniref:nose resistant to fluoxetine protein 6-like n=1 Tax=Haliotis rubra TaxID=36100 RepID=UPI001EE5EE33|nr:nose resistant to fluoxetine protein 6-like [Haliotis rubra]
MTDMLKQIISKETSLLSTLEEVQYFLSPEGLESEDRCTADVSAYLQGVEQGQMWALQMLDASGKPGRSILQGATKFLGNYDECLDVSHTLTNESTGQSRVINGGYCHFLLTLPETIANITTKNEPLPSPRFVSSFAVPFNATGSSLLSAYFTKVTDWKDDSVAVATVVVLCFIVALSLVGTLYDIISAEITRYRRVRCYVDVDVDFDSDSEIFVNDDGLLVNITDEHQVLEGSGKQKEQEDNEGLGRQLLLSFSIRRNADKILSTRTGNGDLRCLHGIRFRMFDISSIRVQLVSSGCLLTFLFLRECEKSTRGKPTVGQMVIYYIHRWWRLTPLYMIIIMFYTGLLDHLIDGPMAESKNIIDKDYCRHNWWANLLYINNMYKTDEMYLLVLGWLVFLAIGLLCCYVTYDQMRESDRQWGVNTRIAYQTLCRPAWALFVSWVILVCCTGNGGVINSILSWSAWIPLGRLTYGAYLIHTVVLSYTEFSVRSLRYADVVFVSYHYIGTFTVSYALSFITCVLVESPCLGLEKVVLTRLRLKK